MPDIKLSIIVCTYNRCDILKYCLDSLEAQSADRSLYEVIVVDNNSTDDTRSVAEEYCKINSNFRYVFEEKQGLSHARNRGAKDAVANWVGYVDDDGKVRDNYIEQAIYTIENFDFDCFGGKVVNWFKYGKPRWYMDIYDIEKEKYSETCEYSGYVSGGISFYKKDVISRYDGFSTALGMNGKNMGLGEETKLQTDIRRNGGKIGFNPAIILEHLVPKKKMTVRYILMRYFYLGKVYQEVYAKNRVVSSKSIVRWTMHKLRVNFSRIFKEKEYAFQNYILDVFKETFYLLGIYFSNRKYCHQAKLKRARQREYSQALKLYPFKKIIVGSSGTRSEGWVHTDRDILDLVVESDWAAWFGPESLHAVLAEHVWEHLTPREAMIAAANCFKYLKPGAYLRAAVPDGFHPDPEYIEWVRPDGKGPGADDHKVLYTYQTFSRVFTSVGFDVALYEYFDEYGEFQSVEWDPGDGMIRHSRRFDSQLIDRKDTGGPLNFTSIILDAKKPVYGKS